MHVMLVDVPHDPTRWINCGNCSGTKTLSSPGDSESQRRPSSVVVPQVVRDPIKNLVLSSVKPDGFGGINCLNTADAFLNLVVDGISQWHLPRIGCSVPPTGVCCGKSCAPTPTRRPRVSIDGSWVTLSIQCHDTSVQAVWTLVCCLFED